MTAQLEPSPATEELSELLNSVPVVMLFFNGLTRSELPKGVEVVQEYQQEEKPAGTNGRMLDSEKYVDLSGILNELNEHGFRPMRLLAVRRQNGLFRVVLVCVHWKHIKNGEQPISRWKKESLAGGLLSKPWDTRLYRNPSLSGGNFIVESGNPNDAASSDVELGVEDGVFGFFGSEESKE